MSATAKAYRTYCFDGSLNVVTADWIQAASDEDAIAKAEAAGFGSKCEIWHDRRLVAQLEAQRRTG